MQTNTKDSQIDLSKLLDGDSAQFSELVRENWDKVYGRANAILNNKQDAEEVAQDTFIRAQKAMSSFRGDCSLSTWLYKIATNLAHNKHWYWFRRKRQSSMSLQANIGDSEDSLTFEDTISAPTQTPAQESVSNEFETLLPIAIDRLPQIYSEVLRLRHEDLSYDEIAERLNIGVGTVKSRLSRAREFLRDELNSLQ